MRAISHFNHERPSILMHSRCLRISDLLGDTFCPAGSSSYLHGGARSKGTGEGTQKAGRDTRSQPRQPGCRNYRFSQNFGVKTFSLEGTASSGVGGSWAEQLKRGRQ